MENLFLNWQCQLNSIFLITNLRIKVSQSQNHKNLIRGLLWLCLFFAIPFHSFSQTDENFSVINPYENKKEYPYKASFHNHTQYHPEYSHARVSPAGRLKAYRDHDTYPPYGIVSISDHNRITTPWNTVPSGEVEDTDVPWGVDDILWLPGNEASIGNGSEGGLSGHLLVVNTLTKQLSEPNWNIKENKSTISGWLYVSDEVPPSVNFSFSGKEIRIIGTRLPSGGIGKVYLNGDESGKINFYASDTLYKQVLFTATQLNDSAINLEIVYNKKGQSENRYIGTINLDVFQVIDSYKTIQNYPCTHAAITYQPLKYAHASLKRQYGTGVEKTFRTYIEDGCFLVLSHPNSRLVMEGEHKGKQLWNSSGYVFDELDIIYGNAEKEIPGFSFQPHAIEIGNQGYDFSVRTNFTNAEEKWDYLLKQGHRVMGIASDDSHGNTPRQGWIVVFTRAVKPEQLTSNDVMESLFEGNFYASQGPDMVIDLNHNQLTVSTEKPSLIEFLSDDGIIQSKYGVRSATYLITGNEIYVRARVTRADRDWKNIDGGIGRTRSAWTNPFYIIPK